MKSIAIAAGCCLVPGTAGAREIHVAKTGNDTHDGSAAKPLLTITAAAAKAQPGDTVTVHAGVYRERVNPPRGGTSDDRRITYQAAPGEKVTITGSEPAKGWEKVDNDTWKLTLPNSYFGKFNPYAEKVYGDWFDPRGRVHHRGCVYLNGDWLAEAPNLDAVMQPAGQTPLWFATVDGVVGRRAGIPPERRLVPAGGRRRRSRRASPPPAAAPRTRRAPRAASASAIIKKGNWLRYDDVDFGDGAESVEIRAAAAVGAGGTIELRLDKADGELLGTCDVPVTGDWQKWQSFTAKIKKTEGRKNLCLVFQSDQTRQARKPGSDNTVIYAQFPGVNPNEAAGRDQRPADRLHAGEDQHRLHHRPRLRPAQRRHELGRAHRRPGRAGHRLLVQGLDHREQRDQLLPLLRHRAGQVFRPVGRQARQHRRLLPDHRRRAQEGRLDQGEDRRPPRPQQPHPPLRADRHRRQPRLRVQQGSSATRSTTSTCRGSGAARRWRASSSTARIDVVIAGNHIYRCGDLGGHLARLDGAGHAGHRQPPARQHELGRRPVLRGGPRPVPGRQQPLPLPEGPPRQLAGRRLRPQPDLPAACRSSPDGRQTPYFKAHSTEMVGMHDCPVGDVRLYNNLLAARANFNAYDGATWPVAAAGNVFTKGAQASKFDTDALLKPDFDPGVKLTRKDDGWYLEINADSKWAAEQKRKLVTTELLGKAKIPDLPFRKPRRLAAQARHRLLRQQAQRGQPVPRPVRDPQGRQTGNQSLAEVMVPG